MSTETKTETMTAERLAEIRGRILRVALIGDDKLVAYRDDIRALARQDVPALIAALKAEQARRAQAVDDAVETMNNLERERDEARAQLEALALDALAHLSGAGICTPLEGYIQAPHCLGSNIDALAKERDQAREEGNDAIRYLTDTARALGLLPSTARWQVPELTRARLAELEWELTKIATAVNAAEQRLGMRLVRSDPKP